MEGGRPAGLAV